MSPGAIVAIVAVVLLMLGAAAVGGVLFWRRRCGLAGSSQRGHTKPHNSGHADQNGAGTEYINPIADHPIGRLAENATYVSQEVPAATHESSA